MQVESLNCQSCGGALNVKSSVCVCEYCGVTNIISGETGKYIDLLNRANYLRQHCEFDRAFRIYDEILDNTPPFADILWAQTLCEYGIEYVEDPISSRYIPTLHRINDESILEFRTYREALELCDEEQKEKLQRSAEEINEIQQKYLNIASKEKPYDVFICYKEADEDTKKRTKDSELAEELYDELTDYGYKVFYSRTTLKDKLGIDFEPYIFAALKSSKVMVVFGTRAEYIESPWVKNEWSRFLKLKENDSTKQIFFACDDANDLPRAFSLKQAQILSDDDAIENLADNINNYIIGKTGESDTAHMVLAKCPNCHTTQKVKPRAEAAVCSNCHKPYIVSEGIGLMDIHRKSVVKCPVCGKSQEKNKFGCIYCHSSF